MIGHLLGDRYKVIQVLGSGGMGQTFIAEDTHLPNNFRCVVKQLKPASTDANTLEIASRLFDTEAKSLQQLGDHAQIPRLLAHFECQQEFYLVQELVDGHSLSQEISLDAQQWSESQVIDFLKDMLGILQFIHSQNVIHRDIKPGNIMRRHKDNKLVLIDFGAVKIIQSQLLTNIDYTKPTPTTITIAIGTKGYMPQEQLEGKPCIVSDLYALGIVAIQALTGLLPTQFKRDDTGEIIWHRYAEVSDELAAVLTKMVRQFYKQRFQSATEVLVALTAIDTSCPQPDYTSTIPVTAPGATSFNQARQTNTFQTDIDEDPPEVLNSPKPTPSAKPTASKARFSKRWQIPSAIGASVCLVVGAGYFALVQAAQQQRTTQESEVQNLLKGREYGECTNRSQSYLTSNSLLQSLGDHDAVAQLQTLHDQCQQLQNQQTALQNLKNLASDEKNIDECISQAKAFPEPKSSDLYRQAHDVLGNCQLAKAKQLANSEHFAQAIDIVVREITPDMSVYGETQRLISEWSEKIFEYAEQKYLNATDDKGFKEALQIAGAVPQNNSAYEKAQNKIQAWKQQEEKDRGAYAGAKKAVSEKNWNDARTAANQLLSSPVIAWRNSAKLILSEIEASEKPLDVQGTLTNSSPKRSANQTPYADHTFHGEAGQSIMILMESADFDTQLFLVSPSEHVIGNDDGFREGFDSVIRITLPETGTYRVRANAFKPDGRGQYHLTVSSR
jgi:serine/threonine protein kinase, bacterial